MRFLDHLPVAFCKAAVAAAIATTVVIPAIVDNPDQPAQPAMCTTDHDCETRFPILAERYLR